MAPQNHFNRPIHDPWTLDKKIPVSVILVLVAQTMTFAWWAATIDYKVANSERRIEQLEVSSNLRDRDVSLANERLARIEEQQKAQLEILRRLDEQNTRRR